MLCFPTDSVYGQWLHDVEAREDHILVDGRKVTFSAVATQDHAWDADILLECTGKWKTEAEMNTFLAHGAKRVVVSRPVDGVLNVVMGVNHGLYDPSMHRVVTAASCTTNCLAPVVKVIKESFGIKHGAITTIHNVTNTQTVHDKPMDDLRRARSCLNALVPSTTGSAKAIAMIFPELKGKLNGLAVRVAVLNASITDCVFEVERPVSKEEVNAALHAAGQGSLRGILRVEERPLVSVDYKGESHSAVIDALSTMVVDGTCIKILAWYDNEYGYALRMAELVRFVATVV
jgi:glyceraldehyde 3-phosphate dehydrogenase